MKLLTEELEKGLTASVVELISIGQGAAVLKALGQLERGAIVGGHCDAIMESAAHVCRTNEKVTMADLLSDLASRFEQPESTKHYLLEQLATGHTTPDPARICGEFAAQINQRFQQEQIAIQATTLAAEARNGRAVLSELRGLVDQLESTAESSTCISWSQAVDQLLTTDPDQYVPTNHAWFDNAYGGLPVGLSVFAGTPGVGKSALGLQLALGAVSAGKRMLWAAGEMRPSDIVRRSMALLSQLPIGVDLPKFFMSRDDGLELAAKKAAEYFSNQAFIETNFNLTAIESAIVQHRPHVCCIDYIQLLRSQEASRVEQLDSIAIDLITMARRHGVAIIAISSMSKNSDGAAIGSISRGSGSIDYAADLYLLGESGDATGDERAVQWQCRKNRRGPLVNLDLIFDGCRQYFRSAMAAAVDESLNFNGLED